MWINVIYVALRKAWGITFNNPQVSKVVLTLDLISQIIKLGKSQIIFTILSLFIYEFPKTLYQETEIQLIKSDKLSFRACKYKFSQNNAVVLK